MRRRRFRGGASAVGGRADSIRETHGRARFPISGLNRFHRLKRFQLSPAPRETPFTARRAQENES
jgi:hypothetical protein